MRLSILTGCALLAASALVHAQAPEERAAKMKAAHAKAQKACEGKPPAEQSACVRREMCAQAKDPKACERRLETVARVRQACESKQGEERRECIRRETCAQAKDPAQCEARLKEAAAKREKIREACKDKKGEEHRACIREHRGKT